jgi:hypothetical protein
VVAQGIDSADSHFKIFPRKCRMMLPSPYFWRNKRALNGRLVDGWGFNFTCGFLLRCACERAGGVTKTVLRPTPGVFSHISITPIVSALKNCCVISYRYSVQYFR